LDQLLELYLFENNLSAARVTAIQAALPNVALQF